MFLSILSNFILSFLLFIPLYILSIPLANPLPDPPPNTKKEAYGQLSLYYIIIFHLSIYR